ncbi:MAG: chemotaxis protein CheW [Betaproteobacteria bacterium]
MTPKPPENLPSAGKYLTFALAQERYSVPVLKVREIMRLCPVTPVPRMPAYIKGVINLRGKIVPVVDLRERFGLGQLEDTERVCIVVVQVDGAEGASRLTGMIVDVVEEVSHFQADDLESPPDFGDAIDARFIVGMAKSKGTVKTVLDIDRLLSHVGQIDLRAINGRTAEI